MHVYGIRWIKQGDTNRYVYTFPICYWINIDRDFTYAFNTLLVIFIYSIQLNDSDRISWTCFYNLHVLYVFTYACYFLVYICIYIKYRISCLHQSSRIFPYFFIWYSTISSFSNHSYWIHLQALVIFIDFNLSSSTWFYQSHVYYDVLNTHPYRHQLLIFPIGLFYRHRIL